MTALIDHAEHEAMSRRLFADGSIKPPPPGRLAMILLLSYPVHARALMDAYQTGDGTYRVTNLTACPDLRKMGLVDIKSNFLGAYGMNVRKALIEKTGGQTDG